MGVEPEAAPLVNLGGLRNTSWVSKAHSSERVDDDTLGTIRSFFMVALLGGGEGRKWGQLEEAGHWRRGLGAVFCSGLSPWCLFSAFWPP